MLQAGLVSRVDVLAKCHAEKDTVIRFGLQSCTDPENQFLKTGEPPVVEGFVLMAETLAAMGKRSPMALGLRMKLQAAHIESENARGLKREDGVILEDFDKNFGAIHQDEGVDDLVENYLSVKTAALPVFIH
jgi:hypothetical protein